MKHCSSCENCRKDLLSEYVKHLDMYECILDDHVIITPFTEGFLCKEYQKKSKK